MNEYFVTLRGKSEQIIRAAGNKKEGVFWLVFFGDDNEEVARFNIGDVEGYGLLSARKGPSIA